MHSALCTMQECDWMYENEEHGTEYQRSHYTDTYKHIKKVGRSPITLHSDLSSKHHACRWAAARAK